MSLKKNKQQTSLHATYYQTGGTANSNRRVTKGGGGLRCPFSKIGKKCPNFGKKCPDCGHLWVHFSCGFKSFQEKKPKILPYGAFLSCVIDKMFYLSALILRKFPCPEKFLATRLSRRLETKQSGEVLEK